MRDCLFPSGKFAIFLYVASRTRKINILQPSVSSFFHLYKPSDICKTATLFQHEFSAKILKMRIKEANA